MSVANKARQLFSLVLVCAGTTFSVAHTDPPPGRVDESAQTDSGEQPQITRGLRVPSRSVVVRAKPESAPLRDGQVTAQIAFLDENGNLTSTRPAGSPVGAGITPRWTNAVPYPSPTDPNAMIVDTRHIRAVMSARIGQDGRTAIDCEHLHANASADSEDGHSTTERTPVTRSGEASK